MNKLLPFAALLLLAAGSWAFYPKTTEPQGTTMVIGRIIFGGSSVASLCIIGADGTVSETPLEVKGGSKAGLNETLNEMHKAELAKVNQLQSTGYRLVSTTSTGSQTVNATRGIMETVYYLNR